MAKYQKATFESFKKKLRAGDYSGIVGVKRALGKVKWPQSEKDRALKSAERYFSSGGKSKVSKKTKTTKKTTKKSAPSMRVAKKIKAKAGARNGRRKKRVSKQENLGSAIDSAGKAIKVSTKAITAMNEVHQASGGKIDVSEGLKCAQSALTTAMDYLNKAVTSAWKTSGSNGVSPSSTEAATTKKFTESKPAAAPAPPASSPG